MAYRSQLLRLRLSGFLRQRQPTRLAHHGSHATRRARPALLSGAALGADLALLAVIAEADGSGGERSGRSGACFGWWNLVAKLNLALAAGLALPVDGRVWHVDVDDWMFLMDDRVMLNRSAVSKFGIHVSDITLSFQKREVSP